MQIIHELEELDHEPYCGARMADPTGRLPVGRHPHPGHAGCFREWLPWFEGTIHYGTGGIVSDSSPQDEFTETEDKAAVFAQLIGAAAGCG